MSLNPYFNQVTYAPEQNLLQDLIDESIQIYGHETYYIKHGSVDLDLLFGEDNLATFTNAIPLEMYIKSSTSFAGQGDFISKFGLHIEDQCTFSVSRRRFEQVMGSTDARPHEADLIWLQMQGDPFAQRPLFEIRFVEQKEQLFQLGKLYTYELRCELVQYSHERFNTANTDINDTAMSGAYTIVINLGAGSGAYIPGEAVYQGNTFLAATATGTVYDANTSVLRVQNITGTFANGVEVIGVSSNAHFIAAGTPDTAPTVHDPISANTLIEAEAEDVIIVRGQHPRRS